MKIGTIAKKYGISISAVRYYINLGLLFPKKDGAQYDFNENDEKNLETIIELRDLDFSMKETTTYMNTLHLFHSKDENLYTHLSPLLLEKKKRLLAQSQKISESIDKIDDKLASIKPSACCISSGSAENDAEDCKGLHVDFLALLACPVCGKQLYLKDAVIVKNAILSGTLSCDCGYNGSVRDKTIFVDEGNDLDQDPVFYEDYFGNPEQKTNYDQAFFEILEHSDDEYLTAQHKVRQWLHHAAMENVQGKKVILFPDIAALFLYLNPDAPYLRDALIIVTGLSKKGLLPIQNHLAALSSSLKVAFVVSPDCTLPLADNCVDFMIDYLGSFSYAFYKKQYLYHYINRHFTGDALIIGCLDHFSEQSRSVKLIHELYLSSAYPFLTLPQQKKLLHQYNYAITQESTINYTITHFDYFDYHAPDEQRYAYMYLAERQEG